jgi:hypothetical protein
VLTPAVITALRRRAASGTPLDFGKDLWPLIAREVETADLEHWYTPLNAFLSIGPPPRRVEEMIALIEAGSLEVLGPGMQVQADTGAAGFVVSSAMVPDRRVRRPRSRHPGRCPRRRSGYPGFLKLVPRHHSGPKR